jgi:hypothetical protein
MLALSLTGFDPKRTSLHRTLSPLRSFYGASNPFDFMINWALREEMNAFARDPLARRRRRSGSYQSSR